MIDTLDRMLKWDLYNGLIAELGPIISQEANIVLSSILKWKLVLCEWISGLKINCVKLGLVCFW